MTAPAGGAWSSLGPAWQQAFDQAWASWCAGSLGIGAALLDPSSSVVLSTGRNRVSERTTEANTLGGNFMAHAEMNAFAAMPRFTADGLHLYTTLQPCLMCAATAVFLHVERTYYAAVDEFFVGIDDLWDQHPYARRWKPREDGPLAKPLAAFARVLPLTVQAATAPESHVMTRARQEAPDVAALAFELVADRTLERLRDGGATTSDVLDDLRPRLPATTEPG